MTPERYRQVGRLFDEALEREPEARGAFLEESCGQDAELRAEVERLLVHHSDSEEFLSRPALDVAASLLAHNQATTTIGKQISHYQILAWLGAGGMGQVYLALDTRLGRKVALKLLPAQFTRDGERVRRFAQEAQAASALNHPNILTIFDVGQSSGNADGLHFIATEYVEGQTLRQLLEDGPLALAPVIEIAIQLADALAAAHAVGIVHRDIKPENVMVRSDGYVKVLDFGLAKLTEDGQPSPVTDPGKVMGTISYMSPEQALGQTVDHRSDIFSLGIVLYELLSGNQPFKCDSDAATYNAILNLTPTPVGNSQPDLPDELQRIIGQALEKGPEQRFQTAADLKTALKMLKHDSGSGATRSASGAIAPPLGHAKRQGWITKAAIAAGAASLLLVALYWLRPVANQAPVAAPRAANFTQLTRKPGQEIYPSLSPDGKLLVYADAEAGNWDIYLQRVSGATPINLTKDSAANDTQPTFSPDGEQIAFRSDRDGGGIFIMGATGENVRRLIGQGHNPAWSPDGQEIAYSKGSFARPSERGNYPSPLQVLTVATGETRQVTDLDAVQPNWSPHGERIAYWGILQGGQRDIFTVGSQGGEPVAVTSDAALDWNPVWSPDGRYLYFASDRGGSMNLWRVAIDEASGRLLGALEPVTTPATYSGYISFSRDGRHLVYAQVGNQINIQQVGFDTVKGRIEATPAWITQGSRIATDADFSPDGEQVVFGSTGERQEDLFIVRRDGTGLRQITNDAYKDRAPRWSPDGQQIVFFSDRSGRYEFWMINPDGNGLKQFSNTSGPGAQTPVWSPDGLQVLGNLQTGPPLLLDARQPWSQQVPQTLPAAGVPPGLMMHSWSADGRKLAGYSNGIYCYAFDSHMYERLTEYGEMPVWLKDNRRLLFFKQDKLYLLDSQTRKTQELMTVAPHRFQSLGISRDGRAIYFSLQTTEADIWLASFETAP
jgi:Tol biopolymer transport system component